MQYKYLGTIVDPNLNLNDNFNSIYKKASTRLKILNNIRPLLTPNVAKQIYTSMILPLITYNCTAKLNFTNTQIKKLSSIDNRATNIVNSNSNSSESLPKALKEIYHHSILLTRKCMDKNICSNFEDYFKLRETVYATRNCGFMLELPKCKLEVAKSGFYFMGAKLYNELPLEYRKENNFGLFKKLLSMQ